MTWVETLLVLSLLGIGAGMVFRRWPFGRVVLWLSIVAGIALLSVFVPEFLGDLPRP